MKDMYCASGVDLDKASQSVLKIRALAQKSFSSQVLTGIGGFASLFEPDFSRYACPVLVSSTDGVGTKIKVAMQAARHDTLGIDLVAMCVNDVLTSGADPLFFLDYIAMGVLDVACVEALVSGMVEGCRQANMSLVGGETAEMPDVYAPGEYDLAGFVLGVVDKKNVISGASITRGDLLFALPSSGFHSNGYSLVRRVLFHEHGLSIGESIEELEGQTVQDVLLCPTKIYYQELLRLKALVTVKGLAHITGGGIVENLRRILPKDRDVSLSSWQIPKVFQWFQKLAGASNDEMLRVFNMGVGMIVVVSPGDAGSLSDLPCIGKVL